MNKPEYLIVHHSAISRESNWNQIWAINRYHKSKRFPLSTLGWYVGYHVVIEPSGQIIKTKNDNEVGAHTVGHNEDSIGVCLVGNFNEEMPTTEQIESLKRILVKYHYLNAGPHREFQDNRTCYGMLLSEDYLDRLKEPPDNVVEDEKQREIERLKKLLDTLRSLLLKLKSWLRM